MPISVVIPVGPFPSNKEWLKEALDSAKAQTYMEAVEIVIVDDGADITPWISPGNTSYGEYIRWIDWGCTVFRAPWRLGISHAFNFGVALAEHECVFMLGSDDTLEPTCLERCIESYTLHNQQPGYYSVPIKYMDTGEVQTAPCNAAMVTKTFWRMTGGFPIESAVGVGDSMLLSICLKHKLPVYWVGHDVGQDDVPLYNYRRHPDIHTYKLGPYWGAIDSLRNTVTELWTPEGVQEWTKNY